MSVLILLLLVQFTSQLDAAIVQQEQLHGVDDNSKRFQREQSTSQQCLDMGVTSLGETDPFCANNIERFLSVARSQPENFTLPQDVIDGICNFTCNYKLSQIYYDCTDIWFYIRSVDNICFGSHFGQNCHEVLQDYQLPQQLNDGICDDVNNTWDPCPTGCSEALSHHINEMSCCNGQALLIHAVNNIVEFRKAINIYDTCRWQLSLPPSCFIYDDDKDDDTHENSIQCLTNKVPDVARRDANCANNIGKFINASLTLVGRENYDYNPDDYSYDDYDYNIPQDTIDVICEPNCMSELNELYQQCPDYDGFPYHQFVCTTHNGQNCAQVIIESFESPRFQQLDADSVCNNITAGQCPPECADVLDFIIEQLGCCYSELFIVLSDEDTYQEVVDGFRICGRSFPKPCSQNNGCNGWAVNGALMMILIIAASLIIY